MTARRTKSDGTLNLATGELKVGPSKPTAKSATRPSTATDAKEITAAAKARLAKHESATRPAAKKAAASTRKAASAKTTEKVDPLDRDFSYLEEKDPSDKHVLMARVLSQKSGVKLTPKQVQVVMSMHMAFQASKVNTTRPDYVGLDTEIKKQRSVHMTAAHEDARKAIAERDAKPVRKRTAKKTTAAKK